MIGFEIQRLTIEPMATCKSSLIYNIIVNYLIFMVLFLSYLVEFVTSGPVVVMELKGSNAIKKWQTLLGPTDSATARTQAPLSVRAKFGTGMDYQVMWLVYRKIKI